MSKEVLCIILLVVFFAIMIYVGFYSRKHATDVNGFVLGGRGVGPWLTAFAFGTSYFFSCLFFVGYAGQFWMELWSCQYMGGAWKYIYRVIACMECAWKKNPYYDTACRC